MSAAARLSRIAAAGHLVTLCLEILEFFLHLHVLGTERLKPVLGTIQLGHTRIQLSAFRFKFGLRSVAFVTHSLELIALLPLFVLQLLHQRLTG